MDVQKWNLEMFPSLIRNTDLQPRPTKIRLMHKAQLVDLTLLTRKSLTARTYDSIDDPNRKKPTQLPHTQIRKACSKHYDCSGIFIFPGRNKVVTWWRYSSQAKNCFKIANWIKMYGRYNVCSILRNWCVAGALIPPKNLSIFGNRLLRREMGLFSMPNGQWEYHRFSMFRIMLLQISVDVKHWANPGITLFHYVIGLFDINFISYGALGKHHHRLLF